MRKLLLAAGVVAASMGLAACGSSTKATLHELVTSLGSSPQLQVTLTASATNARSAEAEKVLGAITVEMRYANPSGGALSQAAGNENTEVLLEASGQTFLDLREVAGNVYAKLDVAALSGIPGVSLTAAQTAEVNLLVGGRWFEFPKSLVDKVASKSRTTTAETAKIRSIEDKVVDAIANVIETTRYTKIGNGGYSETGTLESVVTAVEPTIKGLTGSVPTSWGSVKGTYTLTVETSGSSATGSSISITAPNGIGGDATVGLSATFAHADDSIAAPTGATVVSPSLLRQFLAPDVRHVAVTSASQRVVIRTVTSSRTR